MLSMRVIFGTNRSELAKKVKDFLTDETSECNIFPIDTAFIDHVYKLKPEIILFDLYKFSKLHRSLIETITTAPSIREIPLITIIKKRTPSILHQLYEFEVFDYIADSFMKCELMMKIQKAQQIVEIKRDFDKLLTKDPLTAAYNRGFLIERINEELNWCNIYKEPLSVALLDIDFFKKINDTFGHLTGDRVLMELVGLCLATLPHKVTVGRYGGEEFCLLMPSTDQNEAEHLCEKLCQTVENAAFQTVSRQEIKLTVSIGYTTYADEARLSVDKIIQNADKALYKAKQSGRNRVFFEPSGLK